MRERLRALRKHKFVKDASALYFGRAVNLAVGTLSILIYGFLFSKTQIAIVTLFEMVGALALSFGFRWSSVGLVRYGREEYLESDTISYTSTTRLLVMGPLVVVAVALLLSFRDSLMAYIGTADPTVVYFLAVHFVALVANEQITTLFTTAEKHTANAAYHLGQSVGKLTILVLLWRSVLPLGAEVYIKALTLLDVVIALVRLPWLDRRFVLPLRRVATTDIRRFVRFVLPQVYGIAGIYVINYVDVYFIRRHCALEELGAYQFVYSIFTKLASFALILNALFFPRIITWKNSAPETLRRYARQAPPALFAGALAAIAIAVALIEPVFSVFFADKYAEAYPAFRVMLWSIPFYFVSLLYVPLLNAYGRVGLVQTANVISALLNLAIDYVLVRRVGVIGASLGTFVAYLFVSAVTMQASNALVAVRGRALIAAGALVAAGNLAYFLYRTASP